MGHAASRRAARFCWKQFMSVRKPGAGRSDKLLAERFGPFTFGLALVLEEGRSRLVLRRWSFFGLNLPLILAPRSTAYEAVKDGRVHVYVEIGHPLAGLIVRYRGWLIARR